MEEFVKNQGWKKLALIGIAIFAIIIVIIFFLLQFGVSKPSQTSSSQPPPNENGQKFPLSPAAGLSPGYGPAATQWKEYQSSSFKVSYPSNYSLNTEIANGSKESLILHGTVKNATVNIQSYSLSVTSVAKISSIFSALGYKPTPVNIGGINGSKFSGSTLVNSNRVWEEAVVFENNGMVYKLQLTYASDVLDQSIEQVFDKITSSFRLLQ